MTLTEARDEVYYAIGPNADASILPNVHTGTWLVFIWGTRLLAYAEEPDLATAVRVALERWNAPPTALDCAIARLGGTVRDSREALERLGAVRHLECTAANN